MGKEIETKLKVDSHGPIEERLREVGAQYLCEQHQIDVYLDDSRRALTHSDRCLRLRSESSGGHKRYWLTYKGPKEKDEVKKREEVEIEIPDAGVMEQLFAALGYVRALVFEKRRGLWCWNDCLVALDSLPLLGTYVEIEGPSAERIRDVQARLGLGQLPHITESYASLIDARLATTKGNRQVLFPQDTVA